MKNISRNDLKIVLLNSCSKYSKGKISISNLEVNTDRLLDELYNVNESSVYPLNIKETYALRKSFGILDNGVCQSKASIADELGYKATASVNELIKRCMERLIRRVCGVYSYEFDVLTRFDKMSSIALSDSDDIKKTPITSLDVSAKIFNMMSRGGIKTLDDLLTFGIGDLKKRFTEPSIQKLLYEIHKFGLKFIEELNFEEKRKIISNSSKEEIMNSSIAWIEMNDESFKKISKVATTIKQLIDSINNKTLEKILGSDNPELDIIIEQMKSFGFISRTTNNQELPTVEEILDTYVYEIPELSTRTSIAFSRYHHYKKIRDIIQLSEKEFKKLSHVGEAAFKEVSDYLHKNGLFFTYETEKLKEYSSSIHEQLEASTVTELSKKYKALVAEKQQLQTRSAQLDTEINEVLSRLNGKDIDNEQSTK